MPARLVKPHTVEKFYLHRRYCSIFNTAMHKQWSENRGYLELFAGSGVAVVVDERANTVEEVDASPLNAATLQKFPFNRLAFVEQDQELAGALEIRLRVRGVGDERARVFAGDANDLRLLDRALAFLPDPGLIFVFADPEDINFYWSSLEHLARTRRYQRKDFLVNLPIGPMRREIGNRRYESTTRFVGVEDWLRAIERHGDLGQALRSTYAEQLEGLGFTARHRDVHITGTKQTLYDLVFASKSPTALDFWRKIQEIDVHGQRVLQLFDPGPEAEGSSS